MYRTLRGTIPATWVLSLPIYALLAVWGPLIALVVIVTGNHFVLDGITGLAVTAAGYLTYRLLSNPTVTYADGQPTSRPPQLAQSRA